MVVSLGNRDIILSLVGWNFLGKLDTIATCGGNPADGMGTGGEIRREPTLDNPSAKSKLKSQVTN